MNKMVLANKGTRYDDVQKESARRAPLPPTRLRVKPYKRVAANQVHVFVDGFTYEIKQKSHVQ